MPKKGGVFTPQERAVAEHYAAHGNATAAGIAAGVASPATNTHRMLARPAIAAEVARIQMERLSNEVLPLAVDVHIAMLKNPRTPAGALVQAVKLAYDRALGVGASDTKEPHEMTADEIAKALNALKREASNRATVIEGEAVSPGVFA